MIVNDKSKQNSSNINPHRTDRSWDRSGYGYGEYGYDSPSYKSKRKHEFTPVLLVWSTVFDCKHCGVKKETATSEYCESETNDIEDWGTGGW